MLSHVLVLGCAQLADFEHEQEHRFAEQEGSTLCRMSW
jgi:hypothetical protein